MKYSIMLLLVLLTVTSVFSFPVKITSWQIKDDVKKLNAINASIDYVNPETQTIIVYVRDDSEYQKLLSNGFLAEQIPDIAKDYADQLWEETKNTKDPLRSYYSLDEYETFLQNTAAQYPSICQLVQFGTTVENRPLYFLKISDNVNVEENEPEVRLVSSMHGDEVVGYDLLLRLIQLLTTEYNTNTRITDIVNNTELWINPMLNPDGYFSHTRYNGNGVDLNRNFPLPVGSQHPDGNAWQPETIAIMNHGNAHSINYSINYHGGSLVVNYPWDYTYSLCPDNDWFIQASLNYSVHNSDMYNSPQFPQGITNGADWYIALGSLQDWSLAYTDDFDLTVEVSNIKWPNSSTLDSYWNLNEESLLSTIEFVQKGVHGIVTNTTGQPLHATIHINTSGKDITTDPDVGDYHRMLLPGTYTISASAVGYQTASAEVTIPANTYVTQNFVLPEAVTVDFTGVVIDTNGETVPTAAVTLSSVTSNYQAVTDVTGNFSFTGITAGDYIISIGAQNHGVLQSDINISEDNSHQIFVLPDPIFYDDFENGLSNWTVQNPWAITTQGTNHVLTDSPSGNYGNNQNLSASFANSISLLNINNPILSFSINYNLENGYDYLYVYGSSNNSNWTQLAEFSGTSSDWESVYIPLDAYQGGNFYLRFNLDSDYSVNADGVYIDNVMVSGMSEVQTVYGDVDSNWMINMDDVNAILQYSVGNNILESIDPSPWDAFRLEAADVDGDDQITATDAYYVYDRWNAYTSAFPAQAGSQITFSDPMLTAANGQGECALYFLGNPDFLKSITLNFSATEDLTIDAVNWENTDGNLITASSSDFKSVSAIVVNNAQLDVQLLTITFTTTASTIQCSGLVNDFPVNFSIGTTPNDDNHLQAFRIALIGAFPNPFNPATTITFSLEKDNTPVKLQVFNSKGQLVKTLLSTILSKGYHNVSFNGKDEQDHPLGNGIYFCRLVTPDAVKSRKMVLLK